MLANARIKLYVSYGQYTDDAFLSLFKEAGIAVDLRPRPPGYIEFMD